MNKLTDDISNLYQTLEVLVEKRRVLQQQQSDLMKKRLNAGLSMPIDAGAKILHRAKRLLNKYGGNP